MYQQLNDILILKKIGSNILSKREFETFCRNEMNYKTEDIEKLMTSEFENFENNVKNRVMRILENDKYIMFTPRIMKDRLLGCGFEPYEIEKIFQEEMVQSIFHENAELITKIIVNPSLSKEENTLKVRLELRKDEFQDGDIQYVLAKINTPEPDKKHQKQ